MGTLHRVRGEAGASRIGVPKPELGNKWEVASIPGTRSGARQCSAIATHSSRFPRSRRLAHLLAFEEDLQTHEVSHVSEAVHVIAVEQHSVQ